ncbi:MAG: hypothetical protein ABIE43_02425 [Patescibacteria group bacterium]
MGIVISLFLAIISFILLQLYSKIIHKPFFCDDGLTYNNMPPDKKHTAIYYILFTAYCLLFTVSIYILFKSQTTEAIISPWQVIPSYFFLFYGLATAIIITIILHGSNNLAIKQFNYLTIFLISLHYFLSFSIALIIYKIGYGFDPFIHQATVDLINKTGAVEPKTFYYLGQYSLVVILHKITTLSLVWLDKLLVPILAAIFLPITFFQFLEKWFKDKTTNFLLLITLLLLPFSFFIVTNPQNLAFLFLIITIFLGLACSSTTELIIVYLLALTSLVIHPLAGIPALLFALALTVYHSDKAKLKKYLFFLIYSLSAITLPLAFYFLGKNQITNLNDLAVQTGSEKLSNLKKLIMPGQENFILNFIYLYSFNIKFIIGILALAGLIIYLFHNKKCRIFLLSFGMSLSLFIAYFLTKQLPFNFLITYERQNYSDRILIAAIIFTLPFIITILYWLIDRIKNQKKTVSILFFIFASILITASLYLSYPRFDNYFNSHGYSISQNDIEAVHWIEENTDKNYIVLANQQVSATALREFGFNHYITVPPPYDGAGQGEIYFYPIPTSGQLYQYYLNMVYEKPNKETMQKAMDYAGVKEAYFVLNKYWWAFDKILEEAKLEADNWQEIANGEIYVFKYVK